MRWVRSRQKLGAWCALFAVTVQLVLSFGHVHVAGIGSGAGTTVLADRASATDRAQPIVPQSRRLPVWPTTSVPSAP